MKDLARSEAEIFLSIGPGDRIEALDSRRSRWEGTVDMAANDNGVLWIHTSGGERKLLDIWEYEIRKLEPH